MKVITLCGSTKFKEQFREIEALLTLQGNIVISVGFIDELEVTDEQLQMLKALHFRKIDLAEEIYVIDVDGYVGDSTRKEIKYAKDNNKLIHYYSKGYQ
ncbi:hypothetical protein [Pseudalkalibacillus berkeleyi]|uniref:Uncharacterized protein n=1 Tax=Pseudalkalibacillus berkeleyi TaxID=1069813 RepID=A0ABS9H2Z5_9BACL|nr:hypothetical protein [Pseudalkalibacillus berkeleyi]MCF6138284.1 hypothetical protein [Pseudalkalibacillus berkeleyi]